MYSEHPIPDNLRTMADRFEELADAQKVLDFSEPRVAQCGTVACHGGWAAVILVEDVGNSCGHFLQGAQTLAEFLRPGWGWYDLEEWADDNPELWGNEYGVDMFNSDGYRAFGFDEPGECDLYDIAAHYRGVADRIEELHR